MRTYQADIFAFPSSYYLGIEDCLYGHSCKRRNGSWCSSGRWQGCPLVPFACALWPCSCLILGTTFVLRSDDYWWQSQLMIPISEHGHLATHVRHCIAARAPQDDRNRGVKFSTAGGMTFDMCVGSTLGLFYWGFLYNPHATFSSSDTTDNCTVYCVTWP